MAVRIETIITNPLSNIWRGTRHAITDQARSRYTRARESGATAAVWGSPEGADAFFNTFETGGLVAAWFGLVEMQKSIGDLDASPHLKALVTLGVSSALALGVRGNTLDQGLLFGWLDSDWEAVTDEHGNLPPGYKKLPRGLVKGSSEDQKGKKGKEEKPKKDKDQKGK